MPRTVSMATRSEFNLRRRLFTWLSIVRSRTKPNVNGINLPQLPMGAAHASDLPSLFDLGGYNLLSTPAQQAMAATMIQYWTMFARGPGQPQPVWAHRAGRGQRRLSTAALQLVPGAVPSRSTSPPSISAGSGARCTDVSWRHGWYWKDTGHQSTEATF